jgi:sarcosine oxidase, subunit delta
MSFQIECPNCGKRAVWEYHYGGPQRSRPAAAASDQAWAAYLYDRPNLRGEQTEWWYHRSGCKLWFLVERNTQTNLVLRSWRYAPEEEARG